MVSLLQLKAGLSYFEAQGFFLGCFQILLVPARQAGLSQSCVIPTDIFRSFTQSGNKNKQSEKGLAQNSNFRNVLLFICLHRARSGSYSCLIDRSGMLTCSVLTSFLILIQNFTKELLRRLIWN